MFDAMSSTKKKLAEEAFLGGGFDATLQPHRAKDPPERGGGWARICDL